MQISLHELRLLIREEILIQEAQEKSTTKQTKVPILSYEEMLDLILKTDQDTERFKKLLAMLERYN